MLRWFRERIPKDMGVPADRVTPDASFIEDLSADSIDVVELILAAEEEFQVSIPDEDAATMRTVADVIRYIGERRGSRVVHEECC
jgi:acyl carrier protein